jgi:hypothetical protein
MKMIESLLHEKKQLNQNSMAILLPEGSLGDTHSEPNLFSPTSQFGVRQVVPLPDIDDKAST